MQQMGIAMYRIGICDDDKVLCARLEEQICQIAERLAVEAETDVWYSGEGIQSDLQKGLQLDLLFLDIELAQKNGIEVGRFIRGDLEDMQTHIVYISSKQNYAMQLFKVQPLDFLIKPITDGQLREVLIRSIKQKSREPVYFEYRKGNAYLRIPLDEILYFMSMDKKIVIVAKHGRDEFYGKLKEIAGQLPGRFMTIHQSYIVNEQFITEYSYESVKIAGGEALNISKPYRKEIRSKVKKYRKEKMDASI